MEQHIKLFANHSAYNAAKDLIDKPNVVMCLSENEVYFNTIKEITFTIEEKHWNLATQWFDSIITVLYSALEGMSWGEWVNSEYNINNFEVDYGITYTNDYTSSGAVFKVLNNNSDVLSTDIIIENNTYTSRYLDN